MKNRSDAERTDHSREGVTARPDGAAIDLPLVVTGADGSILDIPDGDTRVRRSILPGGVRVLSQEVPATRSVGVSISVPVGSRDEIPVHAGSTHFLEHLLFKGTSRRSALDIASAFDAVGGESNAETGKESTQYWARVLDSDLPMAIDVLTDMVTSSVLDPEAFDLERGVILDELAMAEDSPTEVVHDAFSLAVHGDTPLGRPVGGTPEAIRAVGRNDVRDHYRSFYAPDSLIVAVAGHIDHDRLVEVVEEALARAGWSTSERVVPRARRSEAPVPRPEDAADEVVRHREVEQAHVIVGSPSMAQNDPRRPVMSVLQGILGGSMSSRLFQEVREKRGLAYSTYAFDSRYAGAGAFGMYAGTSAAHVGEVETIMIGELEALAAEGPTEEEMTRVRGQLRGGMALGLEDNWSRMSRLAHAEALGRYTTVAMVLEQIEEVTPDQVAVLAGELASAPRRRAVVLPR